MADPVLQSSVWSRPAIGFGGSPGFTARGLSPHSLTPLALNGSNEPPMDWINALGLHPTVSPLPKPLIIRPDSLFDFGPMEVHKYFADATVDIGKLSFSASPLFGSSPPSTAPWTQQMDVGLGFQLSDNGAYRVSIWGSGLPVIGGLSVGFLSGFMIHGER